MNEVTTVNNPLPPAPAKARERSGAMASKFAAGVRDSFPIISLRGKVWRLKWQGEERLMLNPDGSPMPFLDVVFVNVSEHISKIYYEKTYTDGDNNPPDCWSVNGVTPDAAAPKKQSVTCGGCKQNVFGSRVTDNGKKAKACADSRRTAVVLENDLMHDQLGPALLRFPQGSLKPAKEFFVNMAQRGYDSNTLIVRVGFDVNDAFPKMIFQYKKVLSDEEYEKALEYENDERTTRMLEAAIEEVNHEPEQEKVAPQADDLPPVGQSPATRRSEIQTTQSTQPAPQAASASVAQPVPQATASVQPAQPKPTQSAASAPNGAAGTPTTVTDVGKKLDSLLGGILGGKT